MKLAGGIAAGAIIILALFAGALAAPPNTTTASAQTPIRVPGIPRIVLDAYRRAAAMAPRVAPRIRGMRWTILAGIGKIESDHLAGQHIDPDGTVRPPYLGPRLDGSGVGGNTSPVYDTDHGRWDSDPVYDRAVGLMQFIPGTWHTGGYTGIHGDGRDGNGDGVADPNNVYDSALAAVVHLAGAPSASTVGRTRATVTVWSSKRCARPSTSSSRSAITTCSSAPSVTSVSTTKLQVTLRLRGVYQVTLSCLKTLPPSKRNQGHLHSPRIHGSQPPAHRGVPAIEAHAH